MTQNLSKSQKVGKNLKNLIKNSKYKTQDRFAYEGIYVDPSTVRRWIKYGIKDVDIIERIAEIFNVDFEELFK